MEKEQTQEGVVEEQVKEETSKSASEAASTEGKATSEKTAEDEWKRTMQSRADKAEYSLKSAQEELQKLHKESEQQRLEARQKEIAALSDEPEEQGRVRRKHQLEDELRNLEERKLQEEGAVQRKYDQSLNLAKQHSLGLEDARELLDATSPKEMELMARLKAVEREKGQGKVREEGDRPDSNISDAAPSDFKQLEKNFIADPYKYGKQYKEALAKRGQ